MYAVAFTAWHRHQLPATAMTGEARTEVLWCNTAADLPLPFETP